MASSQPEQATPEPKARALATTEVRGAGSKPSFGTPACQRSSSPKPRVPTGGVARWYFDRHEYHRPDSSPNRASSPRHAASPRSSGNEDRLVQIELPKEEETMKRAEPGLAWTDQSVVVAEIFPKATRLQQSAINEECFFSSGVDKVAEPSIERGDEWQDDDVLVECHPPDLLELYAWDFGERVQSPWRDVLRTSLLFPVPLVLRSSYTASIANLLLPAARREILPEHKSWLRPVERVLRMTVLRRGEFEPIRLPVGPRAAAWKWVFGAEQLVVVVNLENVWRTFRVPVDVDGYGKCLIEEVLTETYYTRNARELREEGLCVVLYEYEVQVFMIPARVRLIPGPL